MKLIHSNSQLTNIFHSKSLSIWFSLLIVIFIFLRWRDLYVLPWGDEFSYMNSSLLDYQWSFFLPWNYHPEHFMGHPVLQPLTLYSVFSLFGSKVVIAKATALGFFVLCLFSLYKMANSFFRDISTSFCSVLITMSIPLFWFQSTLVLAHIPLMAFGFGTLYAFMERKYKTLLIFSLCLGMVRESALAFFLPLIFNEILLPSHRKSLLYLIPSLLVFFSHFFIFFIRTGHWFAHPYAYKGLPHKPNSVFFDFSNGFERFIKFSKHFFYQFPWLFWCLLLLCLGIFIASKLKKIRSLDSVFVRNKKIKRNYLLNIWFEKKKILIELLENRVFMLLSVSLLFFGFWISYPEYGFRNFFPVLVIFVCLSTYFMIKVISFSRICLIIISCFFFLQNVLGDKSNLWFVFGVGVKASGFPWKESRKQRILMTQSFVAHLELKYGDRIRSLEKWIYMPFPYDQTMRHPFYGYVKNSYNTDHWRFMEKPERYGVVALVREKIASLPYNEQVHGYLRNSSSFDEMSHPFARSFVLFVHRDVLNFQ